MLAASKLSVVRFFSGLHQLRGNFMKIVTFLSLLVFSMVCACSGSVGTTTPDGQTDRDGDQVTDGDGGVDPDGDDDLTPDGDGGVDADGDGGEDGGEDGGGDTAGGTIYYVANDGNDDNDGLGPDSDRAWQSLDKVNQQIFQPGDHVLFRRGDEWRGQLEIRASGNPAAYITYGAYGQGAKPRLLGSARAEGWSAVDGHANVWRSGTSLLRPVSRYGDHPASIFFGELGGTTSWGIMQELEVLNVCDGGFSLLTQEYDWCWHNGDSTVYVYSPQDPAVRYAFVEVPQIDSIVLMADHPPFEYITVDGFEILFAIQKGYDDGWPMNAQVRGLTIKNCHIAYMGIIGADSAFGMQIWHSDMLVQNNEIHDCGRRSISYNVYGDVRDEDLIFENVVFEDNLLHHGYHTTGFDISNGWTDTFRNFVFRNNFIWDDPTDQPSDAPNDYTSMGLYLAPGGEFVNFKIHRNVLKNIKQKGLAIGGVHELEIFNNVIYGMNPNIGSYRPMVSISGDYQDVRFVNNIVYGNVPSDNFESRGLYFSGGTQGVLDVNHNLYFQQDPAQPIVHVSGNSYDMSEWLEYKNATAWDANSPDPQPPEFVDADNDDFNLGPDSPAIDKGVVIPGFNDDFQGNAPDIGAFESPYSAE